ncbi:hypothetical protein ACHAPU_005608 [Fusarium lateritium]
MYCDLLTSCLSDVFWLLVSAIWGTIKLSTTKSSAKVDENDWTFGQILPAFLLMGPVAVAVKAGLEHQVEDVTSKSSGTAHVSGNINAAALSAEHMEIDTLENPDESLEMRRFREHMMISLDRNYYDIETCRWIPFVVAFACIQALQVTALIFLGLATGVDYDGIPVYHVYACYGTDAI